MLLFECSAGCINHSDSTALPWPGSQCHQLKGNGRGTVPSPHCCARVCWQQPLLCHSLTLPSKSIYREQFCQPVSEKLGKGSASAREDLRVHLEGTTAPHPHLQRSPPLLFSEHRGERKRRKELRHTGWSLKPAGKSQ